MYVQDGTAPDAIPAAPDVPDRRSAVHIRAIFDQALHVVEPFFDRRNAWFGVGLEHLAYRVLRERYPELTTSEIHVFIVAARRVFAERQAAALSTQTH